MNRKNKILYLLIKIPNYPFLGILVIYVIYKLIKVNGLKTFIETDMDDIMTKEIKAFINKVYPPWAIESIAFIFYTSIVYLIILLI